MIVFLNKKKLSKEASELLLKLFPNGGLYAEDLILKRLRELSPNDLLENSNVSFFEAKREISKAVEEEFTCEVRLEGSEPINDYKPFHEEHDKEIKKLKEIAAEEEARLKKEVKQEDKSEEIEGTIDLKENVVLNEKSEVINDNEKDEKQEIKKEQVVLSELKPSVKKNLLKIKSKSKLKINTKI